MKEYKDRHDKPLAEEYKCACPYFKDKGVHLSFCLVGRVGSKLEKAADTFTNQVSTDSYEGFLAGAYHCIDVIEGMLEGYKKNGSEETVTALSNLLVYVRGKNEQN